MTNKTFTQIKQFKNLKAAPSELQKPVIGEEPVFALARTGTGNTAEYWLLTENSFDKTAGTINTSVATATKITAPAALQILLDSATWMTVLTSGDSYKFFYQTKNSAPFNVDELTISQATTGTPTPITKSIFDTNLGKTEFEPIGMSIETLSGTKKFHIYEAKIDLFNNSDLTEEKIKVGHLISDKAPSQGGTIAWEDGFFVDGSISIQKLLDKNISASDANGKLLLLWKEDISLQRSNVLEVTKGVPTNNVNATSGSRVKQLPLSDMLQLETTYQIDINQDAITGSIKLATGVSSVAAPTFEIIMPGSTPGKPTTRSIYQLTNGDLLERNSFAFTRSVSTSEITVTNTQKHGFEVGSSVYIDAPGTVDDKQYTVSKVTPSSFSFVASSFTPPARGSTLFFAKPDKTYSADQIGLLFKPVSAVDIIAMETRQENPNKIDLNDDGVLGACALDQLIKNENFGIYRTTLGNVVYSEAPDLSAGDNIPSPVLIPLESYPKWSNLLSLGEGLIATIDRSTNPSQLILGFIERNPLTSATRIQEALFSFSVSNNLPVISAPANAAARERAFTFDDSQANRILFLQREDAYGIDLNGDGFIGNSIVKEITSSTDGAIFELASGEIFFSRNTQLNVAEKIGSADKKLFNLGNAPDKIFAFELLPDRLNLIYSSADQYFTEGFDLNSTELKPLVNTKIELSRLDLTQAEIKYAVDINNDNSLGDRIAAIAYGHNGITGPKPTSQNLGIYSLKNKTAFDRDAYIICNDPSLAIDAVQPSQNMRMLKTGSGGMDSYWSIPPIGGKAGKIVAAGMTDDRAQSIRIVLADQTKENNYFLVTFDESGTTNRPRGSLLTELSLYNEEISLNTDINGDTFIGDTATKLASTDNFGIYQLNTSGKIILRNDNGWDIGSSSDTEVIRQTSLDFISLQQSDGSPWLPAGYSQKPTGTGYTLISPESEESSISQVAFNPDGSVNVYMKRLVETGSTKREVLYNVEFNAKGLTKNPLGKSLTQAEIFSQEAAKELDINGDGFIGKPFLGIEVNVGNGAPLASGILVIRESGDSTASVVMKRDAPSGLSIIQESSSFQRGKIPAWLGWVPREVGGPEFFNFASLSCEQLVFYSNVTKQNYLIFRNADNGFSVADSSGKIVFGNNNFLWARPADIGDFNGDGKQDVLVMSRDDNSIAVFSGNDRGSFKPLQKVYSPISVRHGTDANSWFDVKAARITNDKYADVIVVQSMFSADSSKFSSNGKDQIAVYRNTKGNLSLSEILQLDTAGDVLDVAVHDLNNDRLDDLIITRNQSNAVEVLFNTNGKYSNGGELINSLTLSGVYLPKKSLIADINCDGRKDIIVLAENEQSSTLILAYFGKGGGEFLPAQELFSQGDLQKSQLFNQSEPNTINDFFTSDLNGDGFVDIVIHSRYHNSVLWNLTEVGFGKSKFSGNAGNRGDQTNRDDVINYGQFYEDAAELGLNPSLQASAQLTNLYLGIAERPSGVPFDNLRKGNYYTIQADYGASTQLNISSGKSSLPDISFSLNKSVWLEMSEAVPVALRPGIQDKLFNSTPTNANYGKFSFVVDNSAAGVNYVHNFGSDDALRYLKTPQAVASLTLWGHELNNQILVTNYKENSSKIVTHSLWVQKENNGIPLDPSLLLEFVPDTGQERVVLDHLNLDIFSGQYLSLDKSDFDIDLSQVDFKTTSKDFLFHNFDLGDTLKLPAGYTVKCENGFTNSIASVSLTIDQTEANYRFSVRLVGVSSVIFDEMVYTAVS